MADQTVPSARILLVEDNDLLAEALSYQLGNEGYPCQIAPTLRSARSKLAGQIFDLVLLDVNLPDGSGFELLGEIQSKFESELPVVLLTSFAKVEDAVRALKEGAADYIVKPDNPQEAIAVLKRVLTESERIRLLNLARQREQSGARGSKILGESEPVRQLKADIAQIASLSLQGKGTRPMVLILGETGSGKGLAARRIHRKSQGTIERPFIHVDCSSLPATLIESELFGHEKGAFTQADRTRTGLIEAADDGTIFLDEIGEISLPMQAKLLSVLDRRMVRRVGSDRERPVRASFIAATNRNLQQMVNNGTFRADLFYRLNVITLKLPPLRERGNDILQLAESFSRAVAQRYALDPLHFSPDANAALLAYPWPGNVRELKHVMERAVLLSPGADFPVRLLLTPDPTAGVVPTDGFDLKAHERALILAALRKHDFNISQTAVTLGISRGSLRSKLAKHRISAKEGPMSG
ncbi:MAG: sigma-54-dependent Fis family transcriptional regulator [Planctomycetes bacterium]|nr:sigma-54-dependent Fis family transcriptional regulator [Planctomycetota bacterium]